MTLLVTAACADADAPGGPEGVAVGRQSVAPEPPTQIVDGRGRKWRRHHAVEYAAEPPDGLHEPSSDSDGAAQPNFAEMTDEEVAERIQPLSLHNGWEYRLEELPIDEARQLKAQLASGLPEPEMKGEPSEVSPLPVEEELAGQGIIGADNRVKKRNNLSFPWRTMMLLKPAPGAQGRKGTAQLIGPSTATSVAHVFYHSGVGWDSPKRWATGVDSEDAIPFPDGYYDECYWVTIPGAFANGDDSIYYDFAVMEFSDMYPTCNLYPGSWAGYLGWWSGYVPTGSEYGYVYGFPVDGGCPGGSCNWPQIWGMGSTGMDEDGDDIDHYADTMDGESGAALYIIFPYTGYRYLIGNHAKYYDVLPFDEWNEARRLEGLFYTYLISYSAL